MAQAGSILAGEQLCGEGLGGQRCGQEAAVFPEARQANSVLGCKTRNMARRSRGGIIQVTASIFQIPNTGKVLASWSGFSEWPPRWGACEQKPSGQEAKGG